MSEKIMGGVETDVVAGSALPAKVGVWPKVKAFLFQEVKIELTPAQQQFQDDLQVL